MSLVLGCIIAVIVVQQLQVPSIFAFVTIITAYFVGCMGSIYLLAQCWLNLPKHERGCCSQCGYDLRGTIAANRLDCPECGHSPAPPAGS